MNENKIKFILIVFLIFINMSSFSSTIEAIGVQPLVIDLEMERGETRQFELEISPSENQEVAELNLFYPRQQETGSLSYEEGNMEEHAVLNWLDLPEEVTVPPGEETTVTGEVSVPYDASGSHTAIIMVEPTVDEAEEGITFKVRYAVRVNIHVEAPGLREDTELLEFDLEPGKEEQPPRVSSRIKNSSALMYDAAGEVSIRDESRRLVERISIRSQHAAQAGKEETTLYPGSEVIFSGEIQEMLAAGTYDLQLFLRYADGRQLIERKTFEIGDEFVDSDNMEYFNVDPILISEELRRGGAGTEVIEVRNRTGDKIEIEISPEEIESDYQHSLLDNFELQLRGRQQFELEGRRSERPVLIVRSPREIEAGGYYDHLVVTAFDPETGDQLQQETVNLEFLVGDDHQYSGEVLGLSTKTIDDEVLLSAAVINTGEVHFTPTARVYLRQDEEIIYTKSLEMPAENERILPERDGLLRNYFTDLKPGEYTAEVTLQYQGEDLSVSEFDIEIEAAEAEGEE
ncbi:MAG: hypothetical protein ACLFUK_05135 [Halanaerobium sp.]